MDRKKTDNAEVAATLYEMDEYRFIAKFAAEKDERASKEQSAREKLLAKRKPRDGEDDETEGLSEIDDADSEIDDLDLDIETEADAIMEKAIKKQAASALGNESDDDDFAYEGELESESGIEGESEIESSIDSESEDFDNSENEDFDALFVDSDAENTAAFDEESEIEEEEAKPKKSAKRQKKSVFAAASDYEDALQD